jgi:hypothetical protein
VVLIGTTHQIPIVTSNEIQHNHDENCEFDTTHKHEEVIQAPEGAINQEPLQNDVTPSAGVSNRGRVRRMSRAMQESVSQQSFYGTRSMHYMGNRAEALDLMTEEQYIRDHDHHLSLQEQMCHPVAFHTEMMGDNMYFHQAIQRPDASEFVKAVVKEINGQLRTRGGN